MKRIGLLFRVTVCGLFFLIALHGCSGGGGDGDGDTGDGGEPVGNPDAVTSSSALSTIGVVLRVLLGTDTTAQGSNQVVDVTRTAQHGAVTTRQQVSLTIPCETRGSASFDGDVIQNGGDFSLDGTIDFDNCDGIDGSLRLDSTGTAINRIDVLITLNGTVSIEGCSVTFVQFSADVMTTSLAIIIPPIIANGTIRATCGADSVTCVLNDIDLEDVEAFENSCAPS